MYISLVRQYILEEKDTQNFLNKIINEGHFKLERTFYL